jgi:hypothetical protein
MEAAADHVEHSVLYQIRDPQPLSGVLQRWQQEHTLVGAQHDEEAGLIRALVLEDVGTVLTGSAAGGERPVRVAATLMIMQHLGLLQLRHSDGEQLQRVRAELENG